jgi:hypothetical protein
MKKGLRIDNYYDGYKTSDVNCIDLPIAASAGHFNRDYYFYYCLCYAYLLNWHRPYSGDWFGIRNHLLKLTGLELYKVKVEGEEELYGRVTQCLQEENPVICIVKYGSLFYSQYYKWGTFNHGLIVNDFDDEIRIFGVRDREAVREHINKGIFQSDVMHRLQIDYEQLYSIWRDSNTAFQEESSIHSAIFYAIRPIEGMESVTIGELLQNLLDEDKVPVVNQFEPYVWSFKERLEQSNALTNQEDENFRRIYHKSFMPFFDVIKKYALSGQSDGEAYGVLTGSFEAFIRHRLDVINRLHLYSFRAMSIPDSDLEAYIRQDESLFRTFKHNLRISLGLI